MQCQVCSKKAETNLKHLGYLCSKCFSLKIQKRIRKYTRINKIFKKNDKILVFDGLSYFIVNDILKEMPKELFFYNNYYRISDLTNKKLKNFIKKNKINKIIIPWSLDDEDCLFLEKIFLNKKIKNNDFIKLFKNMTEEELDLFCKVNNLTYIKNDKNKEIKEFLNRVEEKYSGSKFKLLKSSEQISGLL